MNMNLDRRMSSEVMLRIRTIYRLKKIALSEYTNTFILCALLAYTSFVVSVIDVFTNTVKNHSFWGSFSYFFNSLIHSQVIVQVLVGMMFIASLRLCISFMRKITNSNLVSRVIMRRAV